MSAEIKDMFLEEISKTERKGLDELIEEMEEGGFFNSPCSTSKHLCEEEGLLIHSLNVLRLARKLNEAFNSPVNDDSITITALLHDLGKMGDHGKPNYTEKILKSGERSKSNPYETNKDLLYVPHDVRSVAIAERFIPLTEDEEFAILMHNGLYGDFKYVIQGKETPLYMILHFADMWASRVIEVENTAEGEEGAK